MECSTQEVPAQEANRGCSHQRWRVSMISQDHRADTRWNWRKVKPRIWIFMIWKSDMISWCKARYNSSLWYLRVHQGACRIYRCYLEVPRNWGRRSNEIWSWRGRWEVKNQMLREKKWRRRGKCRRYWMRIKFWSWFCNTLRLWSPEDLRLKHSK